MSDERAKVGIIGVGRIAVDAHIPDLRRAGAQVVALADIVPGRAARFAEQFGNSLVFAHAYRPPSQDA